MSTVVVLGMGRSGTSMVASMLQAMGVFIGEELLGPTPHNIHGHFEDVDFYNLNIEILRDAGGDWASPPSAEAITEAGQRMRHAIKELVDRKRQAWWWGWKDPRTCLTIPLYHPHLNDPHYVVVRRDREDVVDSLRRRDGHSPDAWNRLIDIYYERLTSFLTGLDAPVCFLRYEDLTHPKSAPKQVQGLAQFLGMDQAAAARALACIDYKDRWGFGNMGIGVPYFKGVPEFWLSWSWFLLGGLQPGDELLNRADTVRMSVALPDSHNDIVRAFLNTHLDTLCIVEDDHYFPYDQLHKLRYKPENQAFDIVCSNYVKRTYMHAPLPMGWNFKPGYEPPLVQCEFNLDQSVAEKGTVEYEGAAFGFTLIRRWVLERMLDNTPPQQYQWAEIWGETSPDIPFYWKARELGARTAVDRDNWIGHVGSYNYTPWHFEQWYEKYKQWKTGQKAEVENGAL